MVAKISSLSRLLTALHYNENKVNKGKAKCIHSGGFLREVNQLDFQQKVQGFERLNQRNERAKTKTLHISLNFDPSEKLSDAKLRSIAEAYLAAIGFAGQPFLVYRHTDAGHPHVHIVVTTIREDGSRINTHNIGRNQSEIARKELEKKFGLVIAGGRQSNKAPSITPIVGAAQYGKMQTREAINQVVSHVTQNYFFASLPELNAVLSKYKVVADKGMKDSRVYKHRGLNYRIIDAEGRPIGVPVKASSLTGKPTLKNLEEMFLVNAPAKEKYKRALRIAVEKALAKQPADLPALKKALLEFNIELVLRKAADGRIYGITFVDENNKVVFNGSDLGKAFSAAHLQNRLNGSINGAAKRHTHSNKTEHSHQDHFKTLIDILMQPEQEFNPTPGQLLKKKRKKKRKHLGL